MSESDPTDGQQSKPWLFKPGQSGNPLGRQKGSRNKLGEAFLEALHDDFSAHGKAAIVACRADKPDAYLKIIASILPKQAEITVNEYERMDDGQLRTALGAALRDLATLGIDIGVADSQGASEASQAQPVKPVSPLH